MTDPILFALAAVSILGAPGPTNTLLAISGAAAGFRRSLPLVPAAVGGYLITVTIIGFIAGPFISDVPLLATVLRLAVSAYLIFLALRLWRRTALEIDRHRIVRPREVFVITLLNPKALIFAIGVIPLQHPDVIAYLAAFSAMILCVSTCWIGLGVAIGRGLFPRANAATIPRIGAAVICCFAAVLTISVFV